MKRTKEFKVRKWPRNRRERYWSKAYRIYRQGRSPLLGTAMALAIHVHSSREGFMRRYLRAVNNEPPPPPRKKSELELEFEALPHPREYDPRITIWILEPEIVAFIQKHELKPTTLFK
jgi:hypothetical protein